MRIIIKICHMGNFLFREISAVTESQGKTEERDYFFSRIWELLQAALFLFGSFLIAFAKPEIMVLAAKGVLFRMAVRTNTLCISGILFVCDIPGDYLHGERGE